MAKVNLSIDTMGELDGGAARAIVDRAISQAVADMDDRGDDGKPRRVLITLELARQENTGLVVGHVETKVALPPFRTHATVGKVERLRDKDGFTHSLLTFQELNAENPDQGTFPAMDEKEESDAQ